MTDFKIPMSDELVDSMGDLPILDLFDLHTATAGAAEAIEAIMGRPRISAELEAILEPLSDFLRRVATNAATFAPEVEPTTDEERDRKAELMLRHLVDRGEPGQLAASAAAVCAALTCGHVDREFYVAGGWKRAKAYPGEPA